MSSEARDKTVITDNWQIFLKKLFHHFIHHKKNLKVTKFQLKIICRSRVLDKKYTCGTLYFPPSPNPGANRINSFRILTIKKRILWRSYGIKYCFLKDWNSLNVSKTRVYVVPFNNSRWKKRTFEIVMFVLTRRILPIVIVAYTVLLTEMRLKRYFECSIFENLIKETRISVPTTNWRDSRPNAW